MIEKCRESNAKKTHDDWTASLRVLAEIRDDTTARHSDRIKAIDIFAKIGGHYAPKKLEHSGALSLQQLVEDVDG